MLRLNQRQENKEVKNRWNSNTTNVKVKQGVLKISEPIYPYSNTTNVKVKLYMKADCYILPKNSNTTNVKVKLNSV